VAALRTFGTMTLEILALADWLVEAGVPPMALERTGEYWKPVSNLLEGLVTICLVNASHVKHVPGRKTAPADARWLATLMRYGWLQARFLPPGAPRERRDVTRDRTQLVQERARAVNRVQGVLERANIQLASVASAVLGGSGRAMLEALIAGQTDPATMAARATRRMRSTIPVLEQALTGTVRDHQRCLLALQ
jgi:transposase